MGLSSISDIIKSKTAAAERIGSHGLIISEIEQRMDDYVVSREAEVLRSYYSDAEARYEVVRNKIGALMMLIEI